MTTISIGDVRVAAASVAHLRLPGVTLPSGARIDVPVTVVNGAEPGPVLLVTGATHGNEIVGTRALLQLIGEIDPRSLTGTLISVPVANPLAFDQASYGSPQDKMHLA